MSGTGPLQHLNTLWQAVSAASAVAELARHSQTFHFGVPQPITFYLQAEYAEVRLKRWGYPRIEVTAQLQAAFGWRVAADQDDAGVYIVAKRRPVVGSLSRAVFDVSVPGDTYLMLKLSEGRLVIEDVSGALHIPPPDADGRVALRTESSVT